MYNKLIFLITIFYLFLHKIIKEIIYNNLVFS